MQAALLLRIILATMNLVGKIAESRGYEGEELEAFVEARNELREHLVEEMGEEPQPDFIPASSSEADADENESLPIEDEVEQVYPEDHDGAYAELGLTDQDNEETNDEAQAPSLEG